MYNKKHLKTKYIDKNKSIDCKNFLFSIYDPEIHDKPDYSYPEVKYSFDTLISCAEFIPIRKHNIQEKEKTDCLMNHCINIFKNLNILIICERPVKDYAELIKTKEEKISTTHNLIFLFS